jgi:invasion protein IalB
LLHLSTTLLRGIRPALFLLIACGFAIPANCAWAQSESQPTLLQQYGDWGVYTGVNGGNKVCFALSQPTSAETDPPNRPRGQIYLFVSTRPADNVRNEVSVIVGYTFRTDADATAEVGSARFVFQTQGDNAWLKNAGEEPQLVDAMRRGADIVIKGTSSRGTNTTDRYSLAGISAALDRVGQECP